MPGVILRIAGFRKMAVTNKQVKVTIAVKISGVGSVRTTQPAVLAVRIAFVTSINE